MLPAEGAEKGIDMLKYLGTFWFGVAVAFLCLGDTVAASITLAAAGDAVLTLWCAKQLMRSKTNV